MKLIINGTLLDRGNSAPLDSCFEDLPSLVGRRLSLGNPDNALIIDQVETRRILFRFVRFEVADSLSLRIGESYQFETSGNAYSFRIRFALEE